MAKDGKLCNVEGKVKVAEESKICHIPGGSSPDISFRGFLVKIENNPPAIFAKFPVDSYTTWKEW